MSQVEKLGLGHTALFVEGAVFGVPFAVLLADDLLMDCETSATAELAKACAISDKSYFL